ncbi:MAG: hypothetical protein PHY66_09255 [Aliarcobacter sp.]|nr:hypothetical protein [Aliarcobacter sp.]
MASKEWNSIDNFKLESEEYYCVFLDILGYKKKSDDFFTNKYNLKDRFKRAIDIVLEQLEMMKTLNCINLDELKIEFFSDSIILTHPVNKNTKDAIHNILHFSRIFASHLSFEELFVRGGIAKGYHVRENINNKFPFLSSKALERAYELESKYAKYPRIIIDNNIITDIDAWNLKTFVIKNDGFHILHFSPQLINHDGNNTNDVLAEMEDIYDIYIHEEDDKIKAKYQWLLSYYYWTLTTIPNINLQYFKKFDVDSTNLFEKIK